MNILTNVYETLQALSAINNRELQNFTHSALDSLKAAPEGERRIVLTAESLHLPLLFPLSLVLGDKTQTHLLGHPGMLIPAEGVLFVVVNGDNLACLGNLIQVAVSRKTSVIALVQDPDNKLQTILSYGINQLPIRAKGDVPFSSVVQCLTHSLADGLMSCE